jgi:hypothetical protein
MEDAARHVHLQELLESELTFLGREGERGSSWELGERGGVPEQSDKQREDWIH